MARAAHAEKLEVELEMLRLTKRGEQLGAPLEEAA